MKGGILTLDIAKKGNAFAFATQASELAVFSTEGFTMEMEDP
jgi:hypothetical protein